MKTRAMKTAVLVAVLAGLLPSIGAICSSDPTPGTSMTWKSIVPGVMGAFTCTSNYLFSTGDVVIAIYCVSGTWQPVNATCSTTATSTACSTPAPAVSNATFKDIVPTFSVYYTCTGGLTFLSGMPARVSECLSGTWVPVLDVCDEACPIPRDCNDVEQLGFNSSGNYVIVPSGNATDQLITVFCELSDNDPNGGHWTRIFYNKQTNMTDSNDLYATGFFTSGNVTFIGLNNLYLLTMLANMSDIRPQVLEVFVTVGGVEYIASYSNFTLDSATNAFALASLGDYHGNAGDALCPHMYLPFARDSANIGWWGLPSTRDALIATENGCLLTASNMTWMPLGPLGAVTAARMRIRPVSYDSNVTCPPKYGLEPNWTSTKGNWTYKRTPGVILNYTCVGFGQQEPLSHHTSGAIQCMAGVSGGPPTWNTTVDLPCRLFCPDGYAKSDDQTRCNYFSNDTAAGVQIAATKCMDLSGGSLGLLVSVDDLYASGTGQEYYTGHTSRGSNILFPLAPSATEFNCTPTAPATDCTPAVPNQCLTVMSNGSFTTSQCYLTKRYMCTLPSYCPMGYTNSHGGCYMVVAATTISAAVKTCNTNGSDLAYPVNSTHFNYLVQSLSSNSFWKTNTQLFLIGNNKANGTWDSNGRYPTAGTDAALLSSLSDATNQLPYRSIMNISTSVISNGVNWTSTVPYAVCQWQTVIGCFTALPLPTANMTTQNITTNNFGDTNIYTCDPGFWVGGNTSVVNQTVDCRGAMGDWQPPLLPCVRVPVCVNSTPTNLLPGVTNITTVDSFFLYGNLTYTCQPGLGVLSNNTVNQTLTCLQDSTTMLFGYQPAYVNCTICLGAPAVANASTDYDVTLDYTYTASSFVTATCNATYQLSLGVTAQLINCTSSGWNMTGTAITPCRPACTGDPPAPGLNMARDNVTVNWVGSVIHYNCTAGYNMESDGVLPIAASTNATCFANGTWVSPRSVLDCYLLTLSNPPVAATGITTTWVGNGTDNRRPDAVVNYTCPAGKLFSNLSSTMQIVSVNGNWTPVLTTSMLNCTTACLTAPPSALGNATASSTTVPRLMNDVINYTCPASTSTILGQAFASVVCNSTGQWSPVQTNTTMTQLDSTFLCLTSCSGPPFPAPYMARYNYTNFLEGAVVQYTCPGSFLDGNVTIVAACKNQNWTVSYIPPCIITTTAGPTTAAPVVLPTNSPYDLTYSHTTSMMWPSLQNNMTDTDGINTTYAASEGPFGFGYAVVLDSSQQQCLKQPFNATNATTVCSMSNPQLCPKGLSFSIWEKHYFTEDMFLRYNNVIDSDIKYVLSTGGDTNGHPGIALYHYGVYQTAVVSTGKQYWKVQVPGLMYNATWNNLGVRFDPKVTYDGYGNPNGGGLSLFINLKLSGQSFLPTNVTTPLQGLSPPEVILGCHKDRDNTAYRNFGDGEYDELAQWNEALPPNNTVYFLGGYESNFSNISPEKMAILLQNVNLKDPAQLAAAAVIAAKMTMNEDLPTSAPAIDSSPTATAVVASPTPVVANANQTLSAADAKNMADMDNLLQILLKLTKPENLPPSYDLAGFEPFSTVLTIASNLLDQKHETTWSQTQSNGSAGAARILNAMQNYMQSAFCRINVTSDSSPITYVKATDNIVFFGQIVLLGTLTAQGPNVQLPDYKHPIMADVKAKWDNMYDSIRVPTGSMNDDRCNSRSVCLCTIIYDSYDQVGPTPFSTKTLPAGTLQTMGSRVVSFQIMAMPVYNSDGTIDGSAPLCLTDPATLNKAPFYFVFENNRQLVALRQLQFHDDAEKSNVVTRSCAYWNQSLGNYGAFDSTGCKIVNTSEIATACACSTFGIVVVLEQLVQPAEVPYEQSWLTFVKYVLYGISAFLLIVYCIVVAISSDLKEQFHLMGANLSVCVIIGSVIMCVSDIQSIRNDRHMCTAVGTLIQFFYLSVGGWVACLGHASFKAITAGVVGGKLGSYSCVTWGVSLISIGIPFTFFIKDVGTDPRCFISWDNMVKAAFFLPQLAYVHVAFFVAAVILCNLATTALRKENLIEDYGSFCRGAAFIMIYFGITWSLGVLAYMRTGISANFYPIFQIMNSMTGIMIFIFIGLASNRYRRAIAGKAKAQKEKMKGLAGGARNKPLKEIPVQSVPKPENISAPPPAAGASLRPPSRGQVAGRPGSRPVSPF